MGETVIDGYHCERNEPIPVLKTNRLHVLERCTELGCADDKREGKCGHFSIRGYVAEIRKRDRKISWPFSIDDENNKVDENAHGLPPMSVSEFRWWRCPNCLRKAGATGADTDGEVVHCMCDIEDDAHKLLSGFQEVSQESFSEGRKGGEDDTANSNDGECYPSLCSDAKEKEALVFHPSKDGISDYTIHSCKPVSHGPHKDAKVLDSSLSLRTNEDVNNLSSSRKPIFHDNNSLEAETFKSKGNESHHNQCSTRDQDHNGGSNIECRTSMNNNASEFCCIDDIGFSGKHLVNMKEKHDKVTADYGISWEGDRRFKNDHPPNAVAGPTSELDSMELYESDNDISEKNEDLAGSEAHDQHIAGQLGTSSGNSHQKKAQKMRLLTDIIKSEVSGASEKILIFNRNAEIKSIHAAANDSKSERDASEDLDLHSGLKSSLVVHKDDKKNIMRKRCSKTPRVDDKGSSLMSWLKDVAGKVKIPKRYGESKCKEHVAPEAVNSKSSPVVSTGIALPPCQSNVATQRSDKNVIVCKKKNKMIHFEDEQSFLTDHREPLSGKSKTKAGKADSKSILTKTVQSKSSQNALAALGARRGPKYRKATASKNNKMPRIENGTSNPMHWPKDALATSNRDSVAELQAHKKASKKHEQKTSHKSEHDSSDDIPMEIVELMAKNQHERRLLNAEDTTKNMYKVPEKTASMKVPNIVDFTEVCGKAMSGFLQEKNSAVQRLQSSNAGSSLCTPGKKVGKASKKTNGNTRICERDNNGLLSMKQLEQSHAPTGFVPFSLYQENPPSRFQFPATISGIKPDKGSHTCTQFLDTYHLNGTVPPWSSCGQAYDGHLIPSMPFNINIPHKVDDLCHQGVVCHCPLPSAKNIKSANNPKSMRPDLAYPLQEQKEEVFSETNKGSLPAHAYSSMELGNECLSMTPPLDLYSNDTISAMNLLRLMDQGASSSTAADISKVGKQANPLKKPEFSHNHQHKDSFGPEDGVFRTGHLSMCPMPSEFFDLNHRLESLCELSQMHNIGELRHSSHKAASDSHKSRRHLGFINGLSSNAAPPKTHGKGKAKSSHSSIRTKGTSSHGCATPEENVGNAKKRLLYTSDSLAQSINNEMTQSVKNGCMTEICTINRNPAEFTIPGAGNAYMIGSEDLKRSDMFTSSDKLRPANNVDGHKRRRMMKLTAIQGR
ncbi:hypothetical protein AAC387_Pa03g4067 [Persea americana]